VQDFLDSVPERSRLVSEQLTEVMMAQDFQDLTGQVIKKVMNLAQEMEHQLVNVLLIARPGPVAKPESLENGPALRPHQEAVSGQAEVDALLNDLGF
jgi:chemotaxis protein CheZ